MSCVKEVRRLFPSVYTLDGEYITVGTEKMLLWSVLVSALYILVMLCTVSHCISVRSKCDQSVCSKTS